MFLFTLTVHSPFGTRPTFRGGGRQWEELSASQDHETERKLDEEINKP